jgi:hypothetical protein
MRNDSDIHALFQFLCFAATVSVFAIGSHEQDDPSHPVERHNEDQQTIKWAELAWTSFCYFYRSTLSQQ